MHSDEELREAVSFAREAADIVLTYFGTEQLRVQAKGPRDVVTAADYAAETLLVKRIKAAFPEDGIVGEEGTSIAGTSGRHWHLDPLDGTLNFSRGVPIWCVSVALYEDNEPLLGVIVDPIRGETFHAARGRGCVCNGRPVTVSSMRDIGQAVVHVTADLKEEGAAQGLEDMRILSPRVLRTRNIGSAALGLAYVAAGRLDAMVHRFAYSWDYAAGVLLVTEAGGTVSSLSGAPYIPTIHDVCATATPQLSASLLSLLSETRPSPR